MVTESPALPPALALAELLIDIAREMRAMAAASLTVVPLNQTESQIMRYVHLNPGAASGEIADGCGLLRANVSTALRELRGRGLVTSVRDENDGRVTRITATELADETIGAMRASWATLVADAWRDQAPSPEAPLPEVVQDTLERILRGLNAGRATNAFRSAPRPVVHDVGG